MIARFVLAGCLAALMVFTGSATYVYLGSKQSKVAVVPDKPTVATPRSQGQRIPGTMYLVQSGALYSFSAGRFRQLTPEAGWMQPSLAPNGNLLAVKQYPLFSDVYVLSRFGTPLRRLTNNVAPPRSPDQSSYHWSFYPRLSADGKTLWMAYDQPKFGYDVVLSIWSMPYGGTIRQGRLWTNADDYSGGDVQPLPMRAGGAIYTKYSYGPNLRLVGQLYYVTRAHTFGTALTSPAEDCRNPALSPRGNQIAMICTYEKQVSYLAIASWNGKTLGPRKLYVTNQMVAQPTWAPDGSGIAYLAPGASASGQFQLWFLPSSAYTAPPSPTPDYGPIATPSPPAPAKPVQITTNNGFDATSTIAWAD